MVGTESELKEIMQVLEGLQQRVDALTRQSEPAQIVPEPVTKTILAPPSAETAPTGTGADDPLPTRSAASEDWEAGEDNPAAQDDSRPRSAAVVTEQAEQNRSSEADTADHLEVLRAGIEELSTATKSKDVLRFFTRLAHDLGLRLLLLKRWRSVMQVFHEVGLSLPPEASKKRPDGRAPIPVEDDDVFAATAQERCVYAGPVPAKHFPLDLTLMLGRGSKERQIVILPVPSREHWNNYLYLDDDNTDGNALVLAELIARFALVRLCLMQKGETPVGKQVAAILKQELQRREERGPLRKAELPQPSAPVPEAPALEVMEPEPEFPAAVAPEHAPAVTVAPRSVPGATAAPEPALVPPGGQADMTTARAVSEQVSTSGPAPSGGLPAAAELTMEDLPGQESPPPDNRTAEDAEQAVGAASLRPEAILQHSGELPALPRAACHIMAVIDDPKTTATRLEKAIAMDQALTAKVLRIANSPFYGAVRDIKTVSEAIIRLGFVNIRNWTLVAATKSVFLTPGAGLLYQKIWRQSVLSAIAAQLVARAVMHREPETVFIGGLMQNIGQLVLARAEPELFHEVVEASATSGRPYHEIERELLGFDHGELGALLISEWNLSAELEDAVRYHHRLDSEGPNLHIAAMIALGEEIAACTGSNSPEQSQGWENSAAARLLGVSAEVYGKLEERAHQLSIDPQFFS